MGEFVMYKMPDRTYRTTGQSEALKARHMKTATFHKVPHRTDRTTRQTWLGAAEILA